MTHEPCRRDVCGHSWNVHSTNDGPCRVTGCQCPGYSKLPVQGNSAPGRKDSVVTPKEMVEEIKRRVGAGEIVVIVPGEDLSLLPSYSLALVRALVGSALPDDPHVAMVQLGKAP